MPDTDISLNATVYFLFSNHSTEYKVQQNLFVDVQAVCVGVQFVECELKHFNYITFFLFLLFSAREKITDAVVCFLAPMSCVFTDFQ